VLSFPKGISKSMANYVRLAVIVAIIIGIVRGEESSELEDIDRNILKLNLPYGRRLVNDRPSQWQLRGA